MAHSYDQDYIHDHDVNRVDRVGVREHAATPVMHTIQHIVNFILGLVLLLLGARLLLALFGASEGAGLMSFISSLTDPLVAPFSGLFGADTIVVAGAAGMLDIAAIIAMVVYTIVAWGINQLLSLAKTPRHASTIA